MKILFVNSLGTDYVQDLTFSGLCKLFGPGSVVDYPWNRKYHLPWKQYPKNLGFVENSLLLSVLRGRSTNFDLVVLAAAKVDAFRAYLKILPSIPSHVPTVLIDGGDSGEVAADIFRETSDDLYSRIRERRLFDFIFKREFLIDAIYPPSTHPFPISFNPDRIPKISAAKKYDVTFWAVESHPIRQKVFSTLAGKFDCDENGTKPGQTFKGYLRGGNNYLRELAASRIVLNFRGGGWDTLRFWETPAVGSFMLSQEPQILIPEPFVDGKTIVYVQDGLEDLVDKCEFYLKHDDLREEIARSAFAHVYNFHTDLHRARLLVEKINVSRKFTNVF